MSFHDVVQANRRVIASSLLFLSLAVAVAAPSDARARLKTCEAAYVPAPDSGVPGATLYGVLCVPVDRTTHTVQLLVHGGTYTHAYWDPPLDPALYSYVDHAVAAGYATFAVDRLGYGLSTRPASADVTLSAGAAALHDVISALRTGAISGHAFSRVVWVGHSFGSIYAWVEASMFHDVDAFVLTGALHAEKASFLAMAAADSYPAGSDPKFAGLGLDAGYFTTIPGTRGQLFYYLPGADPRVISLDEQLKDVYTLPELQEVAALSSSPPPATAPSRAITVPTLLVIGQHDNIFCGPPDGLDCTPSSVLAQEAPYYSPQAHLEAAVIPFAGHSINLHYAAPAADARIVRWLGDILSRPAWR
jgi:pimeloyl-ACP methyl ester carboxylesterase